MALYGQVCRPRAVGRGQRPDGQHIGRRLGALSGAGRPPAPPAASAIPLAPANDDTRVFQEPWEARAFAITVALHKAGVFTWKDWAAALSQEIGSASCA